MRQPGRLPGSSLDVAARSGKPRGQTEGQAREIIRTWVRIGAAAKEIRQHGHLTPEQADHA
jgi:hypothetical protein